MPTRPKSGYNRKALKKTVKLMFDSYLLGSVRGAFVLGGYEGDYLEAKLV